MLRNKIETGINRIDSMLEILSCTLSNADASNFELEDGSNKTFIFKDKLVFELGYSFVVIGDMGDDQEIYLDDEGFYSLIDSILSDLVTIRELSDKNQILTTMLDRIGG